jgi:putative ABC transport system ATP-binding protein
MKGTAVAATGVYKAFKTGRSQIEVLKTVDFDAAHGELTMVMGPSGSGKSTLVAALSGLLRPDKGQVIAMGKDIWSMSQGQIDKFRLDHCGFIFQGFNLFSALSALQQVEVVLKYQGVDKKKRRDMAAETLTAVGLGHRLDQRPAELSGGEKQRVAIARALAKQPHLIFADEPTSALDGENGQIVIQLLQDAAKQRGAAVICVTHDHRLEAYADRVIHLADGNITSDHRTNLATPSRELVHA